MGGCATINGGGGLILVWDESTFQRENTRKGQRWIYVDGKLVDKDVLVAFVFVYGPNNAEGRLKLLNEILDLKQGITHPIMILGDFNEILKPEERKGNTLLSASIRDFQRWQADMNMVELPLMSRKYTWYLNNSASRIDRVFVDTEWLELYRDMKL